MGQEITHSHFCDADFERYRARLQRETELLGSWFADNRFSAQGSVAGFELEAWLVDRSFMPAALNERFLEKVQTAWISPELSQFNIEINVEPHRLGGAALRRLHAELDGTWAKCCATAEELDAYLIMIGILPSVSEQELSLGNMSRMKRYRALNEQVFRQRKGKPLRLDIVGREHLRTTHHNVMLESATTSFQVHLQVKPADAVRFYNASIIASAATVAVAANAPYLFGADLWDETRIPLFEQAVEVGGYDGAAYGPLRRVSFGSGYARESLFECFEENQQHFPVLLPMEFENGERHLEHLRLHNGTIWRWNRPLIGFDEQGEAHLRIEHRVMAAGPTVLDSIANAAFFYGLVQYLATMESRPEEQIRFAQARDNFYAAARHGLQATVNWLDERKGNLRTLLLEQLLPWAHIGLQALDVDRDDRRDYLGIIEQRVQEAQTGSAWQREWVARRGRDMRALTQAYAEQQQSGRPVHEWPL